MKLHTVPAPLQADPSFRGRIRRIWPNWERSALRLKKGESKMQRNTSKRTLVAIFCLLMLGVLLLFVACGNGYNSPGSPPNGTPQTTPTKGGYSMIYLLDHEIQVLLAPERR
jgi:hypothetical protein